MGNFDGIEKAQFTERLPNLAADCNYKLKVDAVKLIKSRDKGNMFIAEVEVLEADGPGASRPGTKAAWLVKLSLDSALGNIKNFASALLDEPISSITASMCDELVAPDQPATGSVVRCSTQLVKTKAGKDFTRHIFQAA